MAVPGNNRVFLTGAGGFLGANLVRFLAGQVQLKRVLVGPPGTAALSGFPAMEQICADIMEANIIAACCRDTDIVIHLAGPPSVRDSFDQAGEYMRIHAAGTASLLSAACEAGVKRFVYISSAEVYGRPETSPVSEAHSTSARSPYAAAKIAAEELIRSFVYTYDLKAVVLRPFSIYGPGMAAISLVGTVLRQALGQSEINVHDLRPIRDFCYVEDVCDAIYRACFAEVESYTVLNVGSGTGTSVAGVVQTALHLCEKDLPVVENIQQRRPAEAEIFELIAETRLARKTLDWRPMNSLEDGLKKTINHLREI